MISRERNDQRIWVRVGKEQIVFNHDGWPNFAGLTRQVPSAPIDEHNAPSGGTAQIGSPTGVP